MWEEADLPDPRGGEWGHTVIVRTMSEPRLLVDDLVFGEGPRWHGDRLWFSDMHGERVLSLIHI